MRPTLLILILTLFLAGGIIIFGRATIKKTRIEKPAAAGPLTDSQPEAGPPAKPRVTFLDYYRGPAKAQITIIEFGDYVCPACAELEPILTQILETYPREARLVWKDFPNDARHPDATRSAEAARCAGEQGKFWEYHDLLFARTAEFGLRPHEDWAASLGLDREAMRQCLESGREKTRVLASQAEALTLKLSGTPSIFINDQPFSGATWPEFSSLINALIQK